MTISAGLGTVRPVTSRDVDRVEDLLALQGELAQAMVQALPLDKGG